MSSSQATDRQATAPRITPIVPVINLTSALEFFADLGFHPNRPMEEQYPDYILLHHSSFGAGSDPSLHLRPLGDDERGNLDAKTNTFGVYVYLPPDEIDRIAAKVGKQSDRKDGLGVIERGGKAEVKEWGMYEVSLNGPDGILVRVGWPHNE